MTNLGPTLIPLDAQAVTARTRTLATYKAGGREHYERCERQHRASLPKFARRKLEIEADIRVIPSGSQETP